MGDQPGRMAQRRAPDQSGQWRVPHLRRRRPGRCKRGLKALVVRANARRDASIWNTVDTTPEWDRGRRLSERCATASTSTFQPSRHGWSRQAREGPVFRSLAALRNGVNANLLRLWMKQEHWPGQAPELLPVTIVPNQPAARQPPRRGLTRPRERWRSNCVAPWCALSGEIDAAQPRRCWRPALMIGLPANTRCGSWPVTPDMRKGFDGLAALGKLP